MQSSLCLRRGASTLLTARSAAIPCRSFTSVAPKISSAVASAPRQNSKARHAIAPLAGSRRFESTNAAKTVGESGAGGSADFDPHAITAMDKQLPPQPGADFNVVIVGAGNINFGSDEGPWNHSFRLEHKLGPRLKVVGLIDPSAERANAALQVKRDSFVLSAYKDTIVYPTFDDYVKNRDPSKTPHAIWVGSPPAFRGREQAGRDLEAALVKAFPTTAIFIEKPVSTGPVDEAFAVAEKLKASGNIVSVGYMLRYLKVVQKMKQILEENNLKVMATNARYIMA
jgi:hypothetical protein